MSKATEDTLDELHGLHAETLIDTLQKYKAGLILDDNGEVQTPPPAFLAQVAKFLKDNGIDRPASTVETVDVLAGEMPDFDSFENVLKLDKHYVYKVRL